ncbi:MAG: hypothetical protein K2L12_01985 [Clostridia bacterium]|nr:hypothetical protein [Clostridia bacterium]
MNKPRVIFPYTEAGFGHIMPMNSIADKFEEMYGDKVECVRSKFFTESGDKKLAKLEEFYKKDTMASNKSALYGHIQTFSMDFFKTRLSIWFAMFFAVLGSNKHGIRHMDDLKPDLVVSTHFSTNYYAVKCKTKPLTVVYFPDIVVNPMYMYPCDLLLVPAETGYRRALKRHKHRFNNNNIAHVPFLIRKEAYTVTQSKQELRAKLGLDENKFTIMLAEGGYGLGKMEKICKNILKRDLPVTVIAVCGKNQKLYEKFKAMKSKGKTDFHPLGLCDNMFEYLACSDIFCGKSGASMAAEPCFFGIPHIITKYSSGIERHNGGYYINTVGSAMKIFKPSKVVDKIEEFMESPEKLKPYVEAAQRHHFAYGAEESAKKIYELLLKRFPELEG